VTGAELKTIREAFGLSASAMGRAQTLAKIDKAAAKARRMQGRFKRKKAKEGDDNLLERMVDWHLNNTKGAITQIKGEIALREKAIANLKDYCFDPEEAAFVQVGGLSFMFGGLGG
jgi:hypothetical protein